MWGTVTLNAVFAGGWALWFLSGNGSGVSLVALGFHLGFAVFATMISVIDA